MKIIKCPICGKETAKIKPNAKYCSLACKEVGRQINRLKWKNQNSGYMCKYMKDYRRKEKMKNEN